MGRPAWWGSSTRLLWRPVSAATTGAGDSLELWFLRLGDLEAAAVKI
jgi:hypothetical protein